MSYRREYFFMEEKVQTALIEQQKKITMTGVESVDSFTEKQITLSVCGGRAVIAGEGLKIVSFSQSGGGFCATGKISGVQFTEKRQKISKRLFG